MEGLLLSRRRNWQHEPRPLEDEISVEPQLISGAFIRAPNKIPFILFIEATITP
jgi:hypothetical protein